MFKRIVQFLRAKPSDGYTQGQREALVDLLVWAKYVDRRLAEVEDEVIAETIEQMVWQGVATPAIYVGEAARRAREVLAGERGTAAYLAELGERLGSARRGAYDACVYMALVDGEEAGVETAFLQDVRAAFEIE